MSYESTSPGFSATLTSRLLAAAGLLRRKLSEYYATFQLNESRVEVLRSLRQFGTKGCSQTELAKSLGLSDSSVCGLIDRMQSDGLIYRFRSHEDRRRSRLMLSDHGAELLTRLDLGRQQRMDCVLNCFSDFEKQLLIHLLERMTSQETIDHQSASQQKEAG